MKTVLDIEMNAYEKKHNEDEVFGFVDGFNQASTIILYATGINTFNLIDNKHNNIENFLINNGFELQSHNDISKKYMLNISDIQVLYVRIYSDSNKIIDIEMKDFENVKDITTISFKSIKTLSKLQTLILALKS